jgi:hypothetical protein
MLQASNIRRLVLSRVLALGLLAALGVSTPAAYAGHCAAAYVDVWVTLYETRQQANWLNYFSAGACVCKAILSIRVNRNPRCCRFPGIDDLNGSAL